MSKIGYNSCLSTNIQIARSFDPKSHRVLLIQEELKKRIIASEYVLNNLKRRKSTLFRKQILKKYDFDSIVDAQIVPLITGQK